MRSRAATYLCAAVAFAFAMSSEAFAEGAITFAGCDGKVVEMRLSFTGRVVLNSRFLSKDANEQLTEAARHQLNYVLGQFLSKKSKNLLVKPSSGEPSIKILESKSSSYPFNFEIAPVNNPNVVIDDPYILSALKAGKTSDKDPANEASYEAGFNALVCSRKGDESPVIRFDYPLDPYLFYWAVPQQEFRPISWRLSSFTTNPCADAELSDLPHPYYFWYFSQPRNRGKDSSGREFDCKKILKQGFHYLTASPSTTPVRTAGGNQPIENVHYLKERPVLRAAVIFGVIDEKAKKAFQLSPEELDGLFRGELSTSAKVFAGVPETEVDRGSSYFVSFLQKLEKVLAIHRWKASQKPGETILDVNGLLRESGKPVALQIFFGFTDVLGSNPPTHPEFVKSALKNSDMLMYNGHSGLGSNMALETILGTETKPAALFDSTVPRYQMLAYLSCYSWSYFGHDLTAARTGARDDAVTDVVYAATDFTSERGPLGLLDYVDRALASGTAARISLIREGYLYWQDFIIVESFNRAAGKKVDKVTWTDNRPEQKQ